MHTIKHTRTIRRSMPNIVWYVIVGIFSIMFLLASPARTALYGQLYPTLTPTPSPTPPPPCAGYCLTACLQGQEYDVGDCAGGNFCCVPLPTPTGATVNCAYNNGCGTCGTEPNEVWVSNLKCPAGTDCASDQQTQLCSAISAGCLLDALCGTTCHPS